jgi:hypothetical protein
MTEPTVPPPPPPSPFNPEPIRPARGGCPKPLLIGCFVAIVLGGAVLMGGFFYLAKHYDRLLLWSFDRIEEGTKAALPSDLPADERQRLDAAFVAARKAVEASVKTPEKAQQIQLQMMDITRMSQDGRVTREEARQITEILERIAGTGSGTA